MNQYQLLIVESPGKIKKLRKILGANWIIKATMGHFRTLANDGEDNLGFDMECDCVGTQPTDRISLRWQPKDSKSKKLIKELKETAKKVSRICIASDPDREGEVIAWHLYSILSHPNIVRVTYSEITDKAVKYAIANPQSLNTDLVDSGLARSCLDKLVGFRGSPLVWNLGAKSVGRVQSAVLHLVCDRAKEITNFIPVEYFSIFTEYAEGFKAYFSHRGTKASPVCDQDDEESNRIYQEPEARELVALAQSSIHRISNIDRKKLYKKPPPPFITSTLQQASGSKLGFSPDRTMKLAQSLYEKGLITYMRTDSVALSDDFIKAARLWLQEKDSKNVPQKATKFKANKSAQEAHEAIRQSDLTYPSTQLKQEISQEEFSLYLLIWKRAIASQCAPATIAKTTVSIKARDITWIAKGQIVEFLGYARYWNNLSADSLLPELAIGQILGLNKAEFQKKRTSPPSPYNEPQLVALMEKKGIGRPSTYSSSIKTIKNRKYVKLSQKKLIPTDLGMTVDSFLGNYLAELIDAKFTAKMESNLDAIALGEKAWQPYLCNWNQKYFAPALSSAKLTIPKSPVSKTNGTVTSTEYTCPVCKKELERYDYSKGKHAGSLLRCSDSQARFKPGHKNVVFYRSSQGHWWNKEFGQPNQRKNIKDCDRSNRKSPPIRLKTRS
ncbi:type I DNA topoisomerase [Waterburya agarophytonicola K14]|uniref:DNA topoisomerase 1 n=1 Tax=Waterburya agarophytonicola KI4 TaxID=2874699 RepID=A0A964FEG4_9CYAN|nr:type I DNA topoisomerase [Waterburya agarophytonicola]MCC0175857.1 type I DNA topoisomerase [Waterburya agarophytonicola KI4]